MKPIHHGFLEHFPNLFPIQQPISIVVGLLALLACLFWRIAHQNPVDEKQVGWLATSFLSGYAIAQGFFLIYCCIQPVFLKQMTDYPVYVAVGTSCGLYLAVVSLKAAFSAK